MHQETPSSHFPSSHAPEQHWLSSVQSLPDVRHDGLSGTHASLLQVCPQHSLSREQPSPSDTHWTSSHVVPLQLRLQHSVGPEQPAPGPPHATMVDSQVLLFGLQISEQHSVPS
jgi:hypothetical protein